MKLRPEGLLAGSVAARPMSRDKADTLLLLVTCILVLAPHAMHLPLVITFACIGLLSWRAWITWRGNRMPSRSLLLPIAMLAMGGVYLHYGTFFGRDAGMAMLVLLLALKLLEMHARRDLYVVLFLSFFLVLAQFFHSQSIGTALATVATVVAILTTQISYQYTAVVPPLFQRVRQAATILLLAAPLTLVLFMLFPRIQGPLWRVPSDGHAARTGLSDSMSPGRISKLALSDEIAFRAWFHDPVPGKAQLYWRGPVLGDYDGQTWRPLSSPREVMGPITIAARALPVRYQVTLEPTGQPWLFTLELPQSIPQVPSNPAAASLDLELITMAPVRERIRYEAASVLEFDLQRDAAPRSLRPWLTLPDGFNPRAIAFAQRLRAEEPQPAALVERVLAYFHREKFRYTLEPPALGRHVVDEFLFDTRAGFCEHYSSAFVVLMRAMGIPARVITGYQGGEINTADGYMVVRQSDAHAWAEIWLAGRGWVRIDPTAAVAPERVERNLASALPRPYFGGLVTLDGSIGKWADGLRLLRNNAEAIANAWNQWVLNYTPERQKNLLQKLGFQHPSWKTLVMLLAIIGGLVLVATAVPLLRNRTSRDPIEEVYRAFCQRMEARGCPRLPYEGPREYGSRICAEDSQLSEREKIATKRFLRLYEAVRYGPMAQNTAAPAASNLKTLLAQCR